MLLLPISRAPTTTSRAPAATATARRRRRVIRATAAKGATDGRRRMARPRRVGAAAVAAAGAQEARRERERIVRHARPREHLELLRGDALAALRCRGLRRAFRVVVEARDHVACGRAVEVLGLFARDLFFAGGLFSG